jgi:two-component system sensor histidine kinase BaeS
MAVPDSFPRMYLDPFYFKQALGSVLENAVQYSNKGGAITLSLSQDAEWACIEVHNTGQGIAAEDLPHIFEHFYRAERVREMVKGGIGLGLPLARRVVEAHGGRIEVDNQPGEGVTFRLYFPLTDPAPPAEQTAADVP